MSSAVLWSPSPVPLAGATPRRSRRRRHRDRERLAADRLRSTIETATARLNGEVLEDIEAHGDDLTLDVVRGCSHWIPEERPDLIAGQARALFG